MEIRFGASSMIKKALILAGGFGTRLHPLTLHTPKPLLPVLGKPIIEYLLEGLKKAGIAEVTISINKALENSLREFIGDGKTRFGLDIGFIVEPAESEETKLGAVGAMAHAAGFHDIGKEDGYYLIAGADNFSPGFDFGKFFGAHVSSGRKASIALHKETNREKLSQLGVAVVDSTGRITGFQEKPRPEEAKSDLVSTAYYVVGPEFFREYVPRYTGELKAAGKKPDNIGGIFEKLLEWNVPIHGHVFSEYWTDVGKPRSYLEANGHMMSQMGDEVRIDGSAVVSEKAEMKGPCVIGHECRISDGARIMPFTQLIRNVQVGKNSLIENVMVFPHVKTGDSCILRNCIIDSFSEIGDGVCIDDYAIIGRKSRLASGTRISVQA